MSSAVKRPSADADAVVTTRRQSYVRMGDPADRKLSLGRRRSSGKEDVWDVTMDIEEEVEYVPWAGIKCSFFILVTSWSRNHPLYLN